MSRYQALVTDPFSRAAPVSVELNGADMTWAASDTGTWNGEVPTAHLKAADLLPDPCGKWLTWRHGPLDWRGVVAQADHDLATGTTELVAKTWDWLLAGRRLPRLGSGTAANAGDLLRRAIEDRNRGSDRVGLSVVADRTGPTVPAIARAQDLHDLLRDLPDLADGDWRVDHDARAIEWRRRLGRDLTGSVVVSEGRHIVGGRFSIDREAASNEVTVVPNDAPFALTPSVTVRDDADVAARGLRQKTVVLPGLLSRAELRPAAQRELARLVRQGRTLELELCNEDRIFERFREGDVLLAVLPSCNARVKLRVMVRHFSTETDILTVTGDCAEIR